VYVNINNEKYLKSKLKIEISEVLQFDHRESRIKLVSPEMVNITQRSIQFYSVLRVKKYLKNFSRQIEFHETRNFLKELTRKGVL